MAAIAGKTLRNLTLEYSFNWPAIASRGHRTAPDAPESWRWTANAAAARHAGQKKGGPKGRLCLPPGMPRLASLALLALLALALRQLLANSCRFAGPPAQVIKLGAAHVTLALDLDAGNER